MAISPEVQAVLDLCEIQGVPVKFENSVFVIKKIDLPRIQKPRILGRPKHLATQNIDTVIRWIEEHKTWNTPKQ